MLSRNLNPVSLRLKKRQRANPVKFEIDVARAAPDIPISGQPNRPKINTALRIMFRNTMTMLAMVHCLTNPTFLRSVS